MTSRVGIIYLCHGNRSYIDDVIAAFEALDYPRDLLTLYFVPNHSPDGIADYIRQTILPRSGKDFPEVVLLDDGVNRGFAGGNNIAIRDGIGRNLDFILLNNGDLRLHKDSVKKMVEAMEVDEKIASAQPLVLYWKDEEKINVSGGMFHLAGYGYARDNLMPRNKMDFSEVEDVAFVSGAAAMYRLEALKSVGDLEEGFFMYHEDLELGLRLRFAGYRNVLVSSALAYHDYAFSRNPKKFAWMELYRLVVVFSYYRLATLALIFPALFCVEVSAWLLALKGGWVRAKVWALREWFRPATWKLIFGMRRRAARLRTIPDGELLRFVTGKIEAQEQHNAVVEYVANPILTLYVRILRLMVKW